MAQIDAHVTPDAASGKQCAEGDKNPTPLDPAAGIG
jgi:hypothetical protein